PDALMLALLVALAWGFIGVDAIRPPLIGFMTAYCFAAAVTLSRIGPRGAGVLTWAGLAAMIRIGDGDVHLLSMIALATYVVAHIGVERSLHTFPWGLDEQKFPEPK